MGRPKAIITDTRTCPSCQRELPRTNEFFYRDKQRNDGLSAYCKDCRKRMSREYVTNNPEKVRESSRRTRQKYPDRIRARRIMFRLRRPEYSRERSAKMRQEHPEEYRAYQRQWQNARNRANPERMRNLSQAWRDANPEKSIEVQRRYAKKHPDKVRSNHAQRRARELNAEGSHAAEDITAQYRRQKGKCYWCGVRIKDNKYHVDHIIPLARGGTNDPSNLVVACPKCNLSKSDKLPHEWKGSGGRLL